MTAQVIHFIGANDCLVREVLHYKDLFTPSGLQVFALCYYHQEFLFILYPENALIQFYRYI